MTSWASFRKAFFLEKIKEERSAEDQAITHNLHHLSHILEAYNQTYEAWILQKWCRTRIL